MKTKPNMAIFRIPAEDDELNAFVQVAIADDGFVEPEGDIFSVGAEDSYNELTFAQIVLAEKVEGGSRSLACFTIGKPGGGDDPAPEEVHLLGTELYDIIPHLIDVYMERNNEANDRQDSASVKG